MWVLVMTVLGMVVLAALAWWASGRSGPLLRMDDEAARQRADQVAHDEMTGVRMPPPGAGF